MADFIIKLFKFNLRQSWAVGKIFEAWKSLFSSGGAFFKAFLPCAIVVCELFSMIAFDTATTPRGPEVDLTGYEMVFCDEFDGNELDLSKWQYRSSGARRDGFNAKSQVKVSDGALTISGQYLEDGEFGEGWYAGMIKLAQKYTYGYFEIKCICNKDKGFWSAFWIQADAPYTPEISKGGIGGAELDIFEAMSYGEKKNHNAVSHNIHCSGRVGDTSGELNSGILGRFYGNDIYNEYNTYGLKWTQDEYIFYVNGVETVRSTFADGVSQVPEQVIVSLEIPSEIPSDFDPASYLTELKVDYVKIYQLAE